MTTSRLERIAAFLVLAAGGLALAVPPLAAGMKPYDLRCEYLVNPLGLDVRTPRLSWKLDDPRRGARQAAYRIVVADVSAGKLLWDSGRVDSDRSVNVPYAGPPLASRRIYGWMVQVWAQDGMRSSFSPPAIWETGILNPSEWRAKWIGISKNAALVRKAFTLAKAVKRARVYVTARGLYRLRLNGRPVGRAALVPDWTDYRRRSVYQTYDVTALLRRGKNAIGAWLGKGWFGSRLSWLALPGYRYGTGPMRLLLQMHIDYVDGSSDVLVSDGTWRATQGPIVDSTIYAGETYDARKEEPGWDAPGFDDRHWTPAGAVSLGVPLSAQRSPTIQVIDSLRPVRVTKPAAGVYVFDFGRNIVGWVQLKVKGRSGAVVHLQHGEVLGWDGRVDTYNLRSAKARDVYILRGAAGGEVFEPRFTYHGFRYVEITGYPGVPTANDVTGRVVHTAAPFTGAFFCSSPLVNRIWSNIVWSQRGNLFSVPTDCPQRDERLGWMGDAQAFWGTACYNMDLAAFSAKWTRDIREAQTRDGTFQDICPEVPGLRRAGTPFWGDGGIVVPWTAWHQYGDTRIVSENYAAMEKWMARILANNPGYLWEKALGQAYGDWMAPSGNPSGDLPVIATATWAQNAKMMADMARAIGRVADAARYDGLFAKIQAAFLKRYVSPAGVVGSGHQTPQALAIRIGLLPDALVKAAADRLVADIRGRQDHLTTGFVGTSSLLPALSIAGRDDVAYRLLLQTTAPSWGYMVQQGGTTIWERWDADAVCRQRKSTLCSFNHFCFGSVGEWLYRYLAGIDLESPSGTGERRLLIRPRVASGLTYAGAMYESVLGKVWTYWENRDGLFRLELSLPPNARARVHVPTPDSRYVLESGHPITPGSGITFRGMAGGAAVYDVPAGAYTFTVGGLITGTTASIGTLLPIGLVQPARAGAPYQLAMSNSNRSGIPVPGLGVIPVDPGILLYMSLSRYFPTVFINFSGRLDSHGVAVAALFVPPMPELVGLPFWFAGVTYDTRGINYIANGQRVQITR